MEGGGSGSGLDGASMTTQSHNLVSTSVALLVVGAFAWRLVTAP